VEKDIELFNILSEKYSSYIATGQLLLINGDILSTNIEDILKKLHIIDYKLIANIPYYITGAILEMFLSINIKPEYMLLMMQKEVGERIINKGGKNSILSLATMLYADSKILKVVHKGSFSPVPKVDSVLIKITLKKDLKNKYIRIGENGKFY
ncbi:MAG: rRNA adenine N-6-methyltransferase family protein, partial [Cyanobium sp. MAG06]|nr:rRNA adenine N-6-methyltransferase family protein [Cyanobium sp. MAG06]